MLQIKELEPTIAKMISKLINTTICYVYVHPVTLQLVFRDLNAKNFYHHDFNYNNYTTKEKELVNKISWSTLVLDSTIIKARGLSNQTGNVDCRGGGCGNLNIPVEDFNYEIINKNGITIQDITEIAYRLKGSKYDWLYELYIGIDTYKIDKGSITFTVKFDYES